MNTQFDQIIFNVVDNAITQVVFFKDSVILFVEGYEPKYHDEYMNLDITEYQF